MAEITAATWNILLDTRPELKQEDRFEWLRHHILELDDKHQLSVLALQEVEATDDFKPGRALAYELFGNDGVWQAHSRARLHEHIGIAGHDIDTTETVDVGHGKKAVIAHIGGIAFASMHLSRMKRLTPLPEEQCDQMNTLLAALDNHPRAVVMGDINGPGFAWPRHLLRQDRFESVFKQLNVPDPETHPAPGFEFVVSRERRILLKLAQAVGVSHGGTNLDIIYSRGVTPVDAGIRFGESDHALVWATFDSDPPKHD